MRWQTTLLFVLVGIIIGWNLNTMCWHLRYAMMGGGYGYHHTVIVTQ